MRFHPLGKIRALCAFVPTPPGEISQSNHLVLHFLHYASRPNPLRSKNTYRRTANWGKTERTNTARWEIPRVSRHSSRFRHLLRPDGLPVAPLSHLWRLSPIQAAFSVQKELNRTFGRFEGTTTGHKVLSQHSQRSQVSAQESLNRIFHTDPATAYRNCHNRVA